MSGIETAVESLDGRRGLEFRVRRFGTLRRNRMWDFERSELRAVSCLRPSLVSGINSKDIIKGFINLG
jgi:hypothetical protein